MKERGESEEEGKREDGKNRRADVLSDKKRQEDTRQRTSFSSRQQKKLKMPE